MIDHILRLLRSRRRGDPGSPNRKRSGRARLLGRMNLSREMDHESRDKFRFELVPETHLPGTRSGRISTGMTDLTQCGPPRNEFTIRHTNEEPGAQASACWPAARSDPSTGATSAQRTRRAPRSARHHRLRFGRTGAGTDGAPEGSPERRPANKKKRYGSERGPSPQAREGSMHRLDENKQDRPNACNNQARYLLNTLLG